MADKKPRRVRLDWIPLDVSFPRGRKAVALGIATGTPLAWAYVVLLWTWAAENARGGEIIGPDAEGILEHAAGWTGTKGALVEAMALPHIRLLDELSNGYRIHDWAEHTGHHIVVAQANAEQNAKRQEEYRKRNALRNGPVTDDVTPAVTPCNANREGEGEREELITTHTLPADARKSGEEARLALVADAPGRAPLADEVLKLLRASGKNAMHASPGARASVEDAIASVTPKTAAARILAAWNPAEPWLTFYLGAITGRTDRAPKRGMATPSTDFTSPEATTL
jgi:hypothetical protein